MKSYRELNIQEKQEIVDFYYDNKNYRKIDIMKKFNISSRTYLSIMKEFGINSKLKNRYTLNDDYFQEIDTPAKAYILGFIYADGYVGNDKMNNLVIAVNDYEVVSFIKDELEFTGKIKITKPGGFPGSCSGYAIRISSAKLTSDLREIGLYDNKSKTLYSLPEIDSSLFSHFVRGYFDGDGYVSSGITHINKGNKIYEYPYITAGILGTKHFLVSMINKINEIEDVKLCIHLQDTKTPEIKTVNFYSKSNIRLFYNYIYNESCFHLKRKKEIFDNFF